MYSNKTNILQLVSLVKEHDIKDVVLCPGSRNAPITQTFSACGYFNCHNVVDERSAGFYALGLALATQRPAAVCCTSGSAILNLAPAISEAFYQRIPLLVITADRPQQWIGQMDGQTLPQPGAYCSLTKKWVQLTEHEDEESVWYNNRLINEALLALTHHGQGPVQINVPISEPFFDFSTETLRDERVIRRAETTTTTLPEGLEKEWIKAEKIMIVAGQHPKDKRWNDALDLLANQGCVIMHEHLSNYRANGDSMSNFDEVLSAFNKAENDTNMVPDLVVTCGGHIVSKRLKYFLRKAEVDAHWHITPDGEVADLFQRVTRIIEGNETNILHALAQMPPHQKYFQNRWENKSKEIDAKAKKYETHLFCALTVVKESMKALPANSILHIGNSNSVRITQLFPLPENTVVCCNRGMNGIEGSLSTAIGYAAASNSTNLVILGDLSFFYDMNVMRHASQINKLRILLINNGCGEIFHLLPGLKNASALDDFISAKHDTCAEGWANDTGFKYISVSSMDMLHEALPLFFDQNTEGPILLEAKTNSVDDETTYQEFFKTLTI